MIKIADITLEALLSSETALEAMRGKILNYSAFADQIHSQVEDLTMKPVKKTTIVVALSRIAKKMEKVSPLRPNIIFDEMSIKSPLVVITFNKTRENLGLIRSLPEAVSKTSFLTLTEGLNEITIIASEEAKNNILSYIKSPPKEILSGLIGITIKFSERYISEPNVIYAILAKIAVKRINLIEIVSTYTELTLVIEEKDLEKAVQVLNKSFARVASIPKV